MYNIKYFSTTTAFVFCCDAKHSDNLQGSSHVNCYLFPLQSDHFSLVGIKLTLLIMFGLLVSTRSINIG